MDHRPGFTGARLDRADHLRLDAGEIAALVASGEARLLLLDGLDPRLEEGGRLARGGVAEADAAAELIFLGLEEGAPLFAPLVPVTPGQRAWSVFALLDRMEAGEAALWGAARSLIEWHNRHRFCGACGGATEPFRAGWGRRCGGCALDHFPRVDPVVIMLAEHEGQILLARQPQYPPRRYSALAGFVEPGESVEEAVARELYEEAGLQVSGVRYVASQPWPFPGQLMIACTAKAGSDDIRLDTTELEDAIWVDAAEVEAAFAGDPAAPFIAPPPFAIAHTLLRHWLARRLAEAGGPP